MICKKCGKNTVIEEGDHYVCTNCKARAFKKNVSVQTNEEELKEQVVPQDDNSAEDKNIMDCAPENERQINNEADTQVQERAAVNSTALEKNEQEKDTPNSEENGKKSKNSKLKDVMDFFTPIIIALVIAIVLKTFVFANAVVPTGSMLNTIQLNDKVIASRLTYKFNDPERFDIIIFKFPDNEKEYYVKRIIGLPGETVQIVKGIVYVTNKEGTTTQLRDEFVTTEKPKGDFGPYVVPEDSYFVMGDNRNNSLDSRYWETTNYVSKDKIIGKVLFRYAPTFGKIQ